MTPATCHTAAETDAQEPLWQCKTCPESGRGDQAATAHAWGACHRVILKRRTTVTIGPHVPRTQHSTCEHRAYRLTCAEYDALWQRAHHCCEICNTIGPDLVVDHDHETGEVRGLLCKPCNRKLGMVDASERPASIGQRAYLSRAVS